MKLINPSVELITQGKGLDGIYTQIEKVARTCYKSEDYIKEDSAKPFVDRLINSKHFAMLEHGTVYLKAHYGCCYDLYRKVAHSPYSKEVCDDRNKISYLTTNLRVLAENDALSLINTYLCDPTEQHNKRICLKFITSIGISREFNRHRSFSVAEQSTRYCNYSKEKFGNEISFVIPSWINTNCPNKLHEGPSNMDIEWSDCCKEAENHYMSLISSGWKPQQAREVLPLSTATEVVYTAFEDDWRHFFDLRLRGVTGQPHPNAKQVACIAHDLILDKLKLDL